MNMILNKPIKLIGIEIDDFDDYDPKSIIINFWMHSITNRMNEFKFTTAFSSLKEPIERKLAEHGLLSYDEFRDNEEQLYDYSVLDQLQQLTDYINICTDDLKEALIQYKYKTNKETFQGYGSFRDLHELLDNINTIHGASIEQKTILFDSIIHSQHETGDIFEDLNIDNLREIAEDNINDLLDL